MGNENGPLSILNVNADKRAFFTYQTMWIKAELELIVAPVYSQLCICCDNRNMGT